MSGCCFSLVLPNSYTQPLSMLLYGPLLIPNSTVHNILTLTPSMPEHTPLLPRSNRPYHEHPIFLRVCHSPWYFLSQKPLLVLRVLIAAFMTAVLSLTINFELSRTLYSKIFVFDAGFISFVAQVIYYWISSVSCRSPTKNISASRLTFQDLDFPTPDMAKYTRPSLSKRVMGAIGQGLLDSDDNRLPRAEPLSLLNLLYLCYNLSACYDLSLLVCSRSWWT